MSNGSGTAGHIDIGGVFESAKEIYGGAFGTVWLAALIIWVPTAIIVALLGNDGFLGVVGALVQALAGVWLAGTIVRIVQDVEGDGRVDASVGELFGSVWPRLISLLVMGFIISVCVAVGLVFFIVPGVIIALMWIVAVPSMIVEDKGIFDSLGRSLELTKGNWMRILGIGALVFVAYLVVVAVAALLAAITPFLAIVGLLVLAILVYPYLAIITTVLYFRLVEVKDGALVEAVAAEGDIEPPVPPTA
ncbi:MAG: YciC family protein [Acidobacteriota bacterium]